MNLLEDVRSDLTAAANEGDYTAVNTLWLALLKLANLEEGDSERGRMVAVVSRIPGATVQRILGAAAVDSLLNLRPPLETIVSHPRERLETERVGQAIAKVRALRTSSPGEALSGLAFVLKVIRNKREHGFKTRVGPRDAEILGAAREVLNQLCHAALEARLRNGDTAGDSTDNR